MPQTSTINIVISSDDPASVEGYVRDAIDNADQDWEVESATIETEGITTDLLEDEEDLSDEPDESDDPTAQTTSEEATEEKDTTEEAPSEDAIKSQPTGKEF